jgi:hypothetical protein
MNSSRRAKTWDAMIDGKFQVTQLIRMRKLSNVKTSGELTATLACYAVMSNGHLSFINEHLMERMEREPTSLIPNNVESKPEPKPRDLSAPAPMTYNWKCLNSCVTGKTRASQPQCFHSPVLNQCSHCSTVLNWHSLPQVIHCPENHQNSGGQLYLARWSDKRREIVLLVDLWMSLEQILIYYTGVAHNWIYSFLIKAFY